MGSLASGLPFFLRMRRRLPLIGVPVILVAAAWLWPLPAAFSDHRAISTRITDRDGRLLYDVRQSGLQANVSGSVITADFRDAVIAVEDRTFETNPGVSLRGITRALARDIAAGKVVQGGSTVTQQLVRSILKPARRGILYKAREVWLALKVTARTSKEGILSGYANTAFFGQQSYGIAAAARTYFDKTPANLSLAESALLAGLLNAPTSLNPFKDLAAAEGRRSLVLHAMLETGKITRDQFDEAEAEPVKLTRGTVPIEAPHFVFWLLQRHPELRDAGGEVRTTIDLPLQHAVEQSIRSRLTDLADKKVTSAAVVVLDARTGDILSMVGSADYFDEEHGGAVNVAVSARQPGSAIKPFTYALAFTQGMTPATTVADVYAQFFTQTGDPYVPRNYDFREHGLVRLREALADSYNIPAVKLLEHVGVERLLTFLTQAGITTLTETPEHYGLALTLGDSEVKLLELASAYGIFPRGGETLAPRALLSDPAASGRRILDPKVAWLVTDILSDNDARAAEFGRDGPLSFGVPVAAKTGTTRNSRDNWTLGFTPNVIVGVWVGNADNTPMRGTSGITGAGPIFHDVMIEAIKEEGSGQFARPSGIVDREICKLSGLLPTDLCPDRTTEHFIEGTEPRGHDTMYVNIPIDARTGLKAGPSCPGQFVKAGFFTDFPSELRKWARENGWKLPPDQYSPLCPAAAGSAVSESGTFVITEPAPGSSYLLDPLIPDADEAVIFEGRAERFGTVDWYVDGKKVAKARAPDYRYAWLPTVGIHRIQAGFGTLSPAVSIEVRR